MSFDPDVFLSTQVNAQLDTRLVPCPEGSYLAMIESFKPRITTNKETGQEYLIMDIQWLIDDQKAKEGAGRDKVMVRQSIFIDRTPQGTLDISKGKNVQLGRLREAVGQNIAGQPWAPSMLTGQVARVKVTHQIDKDTGDRYDRVVAVTNRNEAA